MQPSIIVDKWGIKTGSLLGYAVTKDDFYVSREFTYSRAGTTPGTLINASGDVVDAVLNTPRIDYRDGAPALLVEPASTNFARFVQQMTAQDTPAASGGMTITTGSTDFLAPDGTSGSITKYVGGAASGVSQYAYYAAGNIIVTAAGQHTFSLFVKAGATNPLNFCALNFALYTGGSGTDTSYFSLASGTALTSGASIQDYGNGWYRLISAPYTIASGDLTGQLVFWMAEANNDVSWPASGALNLTAYTWGAQVEAGTVATTYIPTTTGSATRNADVINASGALVSGLIGQSEGTIYAEFNMQTFGAEGYAIRLVAASFDNSVHIVRSSANNVSLVVRAGGSNVFSQAVAATGFVKAAVAYKSGDMAAFVNGTQVGTTSTSSLTFGASFTAVNLGAFSSGAAVLNDRIRAAALYTTRLTNEQLEQLTKP